MQHGTDSTVTLGMPSTADWHPPWLSGSTLRKTARLMLNMVHHGSLTWQITQPSPATYKLHTTLWPFNLPKYPTLSCRRGQGSKITTWTRLTIYNSSVKYRSDHPLLQFSHLKLPWDILTKHNTTNSWNFNLHTHACVYSTCVLTHSPLKQPHKHGVYSNKLIEFQPSYTCLSPPHVFSHTVQPTHTAA